MDCTRSTRQRTESTGPSSSPVAGHPADQPVQDAARFEHLIREALWSQGGALLVARVLRSPRGRSLLAERPELGRPHELEELLQLPHGTFGHEYARWMLDNGLEPGLGRRRRDPDESRDGDESAQTYLRRRLIGVHDLWHVLTGYNSDLAGELGLLAFTVGQGHARIIAPALLQLARCFLAVEAVGASEGAHPIVMRRYLWRACRSGLSSQLLVALPLEESFTLPIDTARQRLGIVPCSEALVPRALPPIARRPAKEILRAA